MSKLPLNTTLNYSPNFDPIKRKSKEIKFIVFHYTGMKKERDAIKLLTSLKSKVSSHYFIKKNGQILVLVPDLFIAWHAGISSWKDYKFLNQNSIGIEISNPGHDFGYKKFSKAQIKSVLSLSKYLIKKYKIRYKFILGHSDIAPDRKKDPGEKFPWKYLAKSKIGYWHDISQKKLLLYRNKKITQNERIIFIKNLFKIGYKKIFFKTNTYKTKKLVKAFQRRFRQELVNGIIDKECLVISKKLLKKD